MSLENKEHKDDLQELWIKAQSGNQWAFDELFRMIFPSLYEYGYKFIPDEVLVKDAIQDIFIYIWLHLKSLRKIKSIKAYLFISLRNRMLKLQKKHKIWLRYDKLNAKQSFSELFDIENFLIQSEIENLNKVKIKNAIEQLSKRQREAIYLKFYEEMDNDEISQIMNINVQSVYNIISEAIKILKNILSKT
ncbi:MAG: sigma-70 family RNA polymerase sigma factor [Ignavibacterium sp.]